MNAPASGFLIEEGEEFSRVEELLAFALGERPRRLGIIGAVLVVAGRRPSRGVSVGDEGVLCAPFHRAARDVEDDLGYLSRMPMRTCTKGHTFTKTSECPTCPTCEAGKKPKEGFLAAFSAPARRALLGAGIDEAKKLAKHSEKEILALHGVGKASLPAMKKALGELGLTFKADAKPKPTSKGAKAKAKR